MRKPGLFFLIFSLTVFLITSFAVAEKAESNDAQVVVKNDKEEPFLWDLIFSNTKSIVPMVSTSTEIALSPYEEGFAPKTEMMANQTRYTSGDRLLIQNHLWNEGDEEGVVDYYLAFYDHSLPQYVYFWDGFAWRSTVGHQFLRMAIGFDRIDTLIDMRLPAFPPKGKYVFASALTEPQTFTVLGFSSVLIELY